ncbi:MAG TPA: GcrA family cell cycle regulator, partial [Methylocella sp.]|nr:GcrA family cell cycle regulator [Methylocella sp.]
MSWTNERIDLLQKLWLEGCSASQIANELGAGITRNAVIGKVYRLGLSGRSKTEEASASSPAAPPKALRRAASVRSCQAAISQATIGNIALDL